MHLTMFYWVKTNRFIKWLFGNQIWSIPNTQNKIYLTFDDGPTPEITEWVLDILNKENIKATFFCIGENIKKHPKIFERIILEGHQVGNHTFNHILGWKKTTKEYLENIEICQKIIEHKFQILNNKSQTNSNFQIQNSIIYNPKSKIFRPPYGKITLSQSKALRDLGYQIIMWDVLTADFDQNISPEKCFENATQSVESGSIIVFHDSVKAIKNLQYALPKAIAYYKEKGFSFGIIK